MKNVSACERISAMNVQSYEWSRAAVRGCERLAPDIYRLTVERGAACPRPGQFYMLRAWGDDGPFLSRPISVHDAAGGTLAFLFQRKGEGTRRLAALRAGDSLTLTGPLGNGFPLPAQGCRTAVVGGGIGIAPLLYLCRALAEDGRRPDLYVGFRDEPYALEAFAPYVERTFLATDSGRAGHRGPVTDLLEPARYGLALACGPAPMLRALAARCQSAGTPCRVSLEKRMACGIGACLGCTVATAGGPRSVCRDGPVFDATEVLSWQT